MTIITIVTRDRVLTDNEQAIVNQAIKDAWITGNISDTVAESTLRPRVIPQTTIRIWNTTDAANSYVELIKSFTPTIQAEVKEI
jgi:uncharacterized protein YfeS